MIDEYVVGCKDILGTTGHGALALCRASNLKQGTGGGISLYGQRGQAACAEGTGEQRRGGPPKHRSRSYAGHLRILVDFVGRMVVPKTGLVMARRLLLVPIGHWQFHVGLRVDMNSMLFEAMFSWTVALESIGMSGRKNQMLLQ